MKLRSVWVVVVASTMLAISTQTDLAFASITSVISNTNPQSISSGTWTVFAGFGPNSTATGSAYGPITPWTQSCIGGSQITKTINDNSWSNGNRTITLNNTSGLAIGMSVTGSGINVGGTPNRITGISGTAITLNNGSNTSANGTVLTFGIQAMVTDSNWTPTGSGSSNKTKVRVDSILLITNGMTVAGSGIVNSGTNTVASTSTSGGSKYVTLTTGGNSSTSNTILTFNSASVCTDTYSEMFSVNNTGTIDVAKIAFTLSSANVTLSSCSVTWTETSGAGSCTGGTETSITANGVSQTLSVPAGGTIRLRAASSVSGASTTISVAVSTADLQASVINSQ